MSVIDEWLERCSGKEPMNDDERYRYLMEKLYREYSGSFSPEEVKFLLNGPYIKR